MKILAISFDFNASAALLENGEIIFCQSEERANCLKNSFGFPEKTVSYILENYGRDIDYVVFPTELQAVDYSILKNTLNFKPVRGIELANIRDWNNRQIFKYLSFRFLPKIYIPYYLARIRHASYSIRRNLKLDNEARNYLAGMTGVDS